MPVDISRRNFLKALTAAGAVLSLPVSLTDATPAQVDNAWDQLRKSPWFFEVDDSGALVEAGVSRPKINADIYENVSLNYCTTLEELIGEASSYEGVQAHFRSLLLDEIEELRTAITKIKNLRSRIDDDEEDNEGRAEKYDADEVFRLENRLERLEALEYDEDWETWVRIEGEEKFPRFKKILEDFLASEVDWGQIDIWPLDWSSQGKALAFFDGIDHRICKSLGVVIVEGEHPGSTYCAAELRTSIADANEAAEELELPFRFCAEGTRPVKPV